MTLTERQRILLTILYKTHLFYPDTQLSMRKIAAAMGVAHNQVYQTLEQLRSKGYIEGTLAKMTFTKPMSLDIAEVQE